MLQRAPVKGKGLADVKITSPQFALFRQLVAQMSRSRSFGEKSL